MIVLLLAACILADHDGDGLIGLRDCDDRDAALPGASERCNGRDDDCDGEIDEDAVDAVSGWIDEDGDGYGGLPARLCSGPPIAAQGGDCLDRASSAHPGVVDECDGLDADCDGQDGATPTREWWPDVDLDGWGDGSRPRIEACEPGPFWAPGPGDCDDADRERHPQVLWWPDVDGDGHGAGVAFYACDPPAGSTTRDGDCDDADPERFPGAVERCGDGVDQDCDGAVDEAIPWWLDGDGDGWGGLLGQERCEALPGLAPAGGDCDDADPSVSPGAADRVGEALDRDCDGQHAPPSDIVALVRGRPISGRSSAGAGLGDLDGDGLTEVAVYDPDHVAVVFGGLAHDDLRDGEIVVGPLERVEALSITAVDLVGDPTPDLVVGNGSRDQVRVYDGSRRGGLADDAADAVLSGWGWHDAGEIVAPYGAGRLAVAIPEFSTTASAVHLIDGPVGGWTAIADAPTRLVAPRGTTAFLLGDEDFDGDGLPDLLGAGDQSIWLVTDPPVGAANLEDVGYLWSHSSWPDKHASAGDIDGDGLPELMMLDDAGLRFWSPRSGQMSVVAGIDDVAALGDRDGNGWDEVVVRSAESRTLRAVEPPVSGVWRLDDVTVSARIGPAGLELRRGLVDIGDADGDGRGEVMVPVEGDVTGWLLLSP